MARTHYASGAGDVLAVPGVDGDYELPAAATYEVYTARTGGSHHTDLLTHAGAPATNITPDALGRAMFFGQDGYEGEYWVDAGGSDRYRVHPDGMAERIDALEAAGAGVGVTDGDKGDITVSSSGTVWNIDANAVGTTELADNSVTLAKQAQVATATLLGRTTASTGNVEALTATQGRTVLNVANGATANDTDANLKARANHTGTQSADTITDGTTNKAYTATEKTKLAGIVAASATVSGTVELATDAEAITGTDTVRAVTPANLAAALASVPASTEAVQDIVGAFFTNGNKIAKTYDDTAGTLTVAYLEPTPRTVTASATLALGDANAAIYDTAGSANVLTVPTNAAVAFPTDTQVDVWALGAGALTITASATVTLNGVSAGSYTPAQYSRTVLRKSGTNAWVASGGGSTVGTMATVIAGTILRCPWNGSAWTYAGTALVDRPSARTDIFFQLTGAPYATADPAWLLAGDDRVDL